jgi:hypothetical protein
LSTVAIRAVLISTYFTTQKSLDLHGKGAGRVGGAAAALASTRRGRSAAMVSNW